ncbi:MAG TPA: aminoacyl-tRNA hydrolase [Nitrospirota bacterium]|nr:aminoacyl-tRNA hydrolase [Nitrospirota bacterium]
MKIIVGLGNPGKRYQRTRHNAGFMGIDELARSLHVDIAQKKNDALLVKTRIDMVETVLAKPQTFMNDSGRAVAGIFRAAYAVISDLTVIHDELDLPIGSIRVKIGGGHGGHNGLRSLIEHLGSSDFTRVRIGIGRPEPGIDAADYVLRPFLPDELKPISEAVIKAREAVLAIILEGPVKAMNTFNQK